MDLLPARLFVFMASDQRVAVILRRGPSRHWRMIKWDLRKDALDYGQWIKGQVNPLACDISPDGLYFSYLLNKRQKINHKDYTYMTVLCRPPYFTASILWPFEDLHSVYGGIFDKNKSFGILGDYITRSAVNIRIHQDVFPEFEQKKTSLPTVYRKLCNRWQWENYNKSTKVMLKKQDKYSLREEKLSRETYRYQLYKAEENILTLEKAQWADFDSTEKADLLFAIDGCLYRLKRNHFELFPTQGLACAIKIADLSPMTFETIPGR